MKTRLVNENFKSNYTANLLRSRGIEDVEKYYEPTIDALQDPRDLEHISEAAALLSATLECGERILIVVDSDNDGFTSSTIMYNYIKDVAPNVEIDYILHEGKQHGLQDHIQSLIDEGKKYGLIILPDSSSNDYVYHEQLREINCAVLVLDHHLTDTELSSNAVVVNNQLSPR